MHQWTWYWAAERYRSRLGMLLAVALSGDMLSLMCQSTETAPHTSRGQFVSIEFFLNIFGVVVAYWLGL